MKLNSTVLSWVLVLVLLATFGLVSVAIEQPVGAVSGQLALETEGRFGLASTEIKKNKIYVTATGPRNDSGMVAMQERGVWVKPDGSFQIQKLPVGEYTLKFRALGYGTEYESGIFVEEGRTNQLKKPVTLHILKPTVSLGSNTRVFTTKETPYFWLNGSGFQTAKIKVYAVNFMPKVQQAIPDWQNKGQLQISPYLSVYKPEKYETLSAAMDLLHAKVVAEFNRDMHQLGNTNAEDWVHSEFKLNNPIQPGDYMAVVEGVNHKQEKDWNLYWFTVTDIGLVMKQAPGKTLVRAVDLNTLQPKSGVNVSFILRDYGKFSVVGKSVTGKDGFATFTPPPMSPAEYSQHFLVTGEAALGGAMHLAYGGIPYWSGGVNGYKTYFYTERPIYRLGQTISFKGISRKETENGYQTPTNMPVSVLFEDPDGNKLWSGELKTSAHGSFHGVVEIPQDGKTGGYNVTVQYPDQTKTYHYVEVAQYRKPEYEITLKPIAARVVAGQQAKVRVRANYYFGGVVSNAQVHYTVYAKTDWSARLSLMGNLMSRPENEAFYDEWDLEETGDYGYVGDYISEGHAVTDDNGEVELTVDTRKLGDVDSSDPYNFATLLEQQYKVEVDVTDLSRKTVTQSTNVLVTPGEVALLVNPKRDIFVEGEPILATVQAVDYDGKAQKGQSVGVQLKRWVYDQKKGLYREHNVGSSQTVQTQENGFATVKLNPPGGFKTDTYVLVAKTTDRFGNTVTTQEDIWLASKHLAGGNGTPNGTPADQVPLKIDLDKKVYQPGDKARLMISAPVNGDHPTEALISVEGPKLYRYYVVPLKATAKYVELPITAEYTPNVYFSVTLVGPKHQLYHQTEIVKVSPANHFLRLAVTTDKEQYRPGETVHYVVQATRENGQPVKDVEVSLGVVDESIYAIRGEVAPDIREFFFKRRENSVVTTCSFPEEYSGGPNKLDPAIRKNFKDTAGWYPTLITNASGLAKADLKLPDNLTQWRATVRGVSTQTDVGWDIQKITVTQPIIARLAMPRFFTEGDKTNLTAVIHNETETSQQINVTLTPSLHFHTGLDDGFIKKTVTVAPGKSSRVEWPVSVRRSGMVTLDEHGLAKPDTGKVLLKAVTETEGDAVEETRPIRLLGIQRVVHMAGVLPNAINTKALDLPVLGQALRPQAQLKFSVSGSTIGPLLGGFEGLIDYPYGCNEQTMSRLMPSVVAMTLAKRLGVELSDAAKQRFQKVYQQATQILYDNQLYGGDYPGGWGWWGQAETADPFITAYVLEGFYQVQQAGFRVNEDTLKMAKTGSQKLASALFTQLSDPKLVKTEETLYNRVNQQQNLAYLFYSQSLFGIYPTEKQQAWLIKEHKTFTPTSLAYLAMVFQNTAPNVANQFILRLDALVNRQTDKNMGDTMDWSWTPKLASALGYPKGFEDHALTPAEINAVVLRAYLTVAPHKTSTIQAIQNSLMFARGMNSQDATLAWGTTKATAKVLYALLQADLQTNPQPAEEQDVVHQSASLAKTADPEETPAATDKLPAKLQVGLYATQTLKPMLKRLATGVLEALPPGAMNSAELTSHYGPEIDLMVAQNNLPKNKLGLTLLKTQPSQLYFHGLLTYWQPLSPGGSVGNITNSPAGLVVERLYYKLEAKRLSSTTIKFIPRLLGNGETLRSGEMLLVQIKVNSPVPLPYLKIDNPLPSGAEIANFYPETFDLEGLHSKALWVNHRDVLDDREVLFIAEQPVGEASAFSLLRMEMPGTVQVNPLVLEGMYSNRIHAMSNLNQLVIKD